MELSPFRASCATPFRVSGAAKSLWVSCLAYYVPKFHLLVVSKEANLKGLSSIYYV